MRLTVRRRNKTEVSKFQAGGVRTFSMGAFAFRPSRYFAAIFERAHANFKKKPAATVYEQGHLVDAALSGRGIMLNVLGSITWISVHQILPCPPDRRWQFAIWHAANNNWPAWRKQDLMEQVANWTKCNFTMPPCPPKTKDDKDNVTHIEPMDGDCCVVLFALFGAAARCVVPSAAVRRPGVMCLPALCFVVFPRRVVPPVLSCLPVLCAPCCLCVAVVCWCALLFAAVLCAVCVLGCRAVRSLFSPPCAVLRCAVLVRLRRAVAGAWCCCACCLLCGFLRCCAVLLRAVPRCAVARCVVLPPPARVVGCPVVWCGLLCSPALPWCPAPLCCAPWCCAALLCCGVLSCCLVCFVACVFSYFKNHCKIC